MKIENLLQSVKQIRDPRRDYGNLRHMLKDILMIGMISTLCGGVDFVDMEVLGKAKYDWFREFLLLPNGIPDSDTFRRVFERINPDELSNCLYDWIAKERGIERVSRVQVDGKTIRGSGNEAHSAYHIVSAWAGEHGIALGQVVVNEKSNEITAIPQLLSMLDIKGSVVTIDAMGCQKSIAELIIAGEADYLFVLKANHKTLHKEVIKLFENMDNELCLDTYTVESAGHGRYEKRITDVISASAITSKCEWVGLQTAVRVTYISTVSGRETTMVRYFLTSLPPDARRIGSLIRGHWSIENNLHWVLDVVFEEDASKAKKDNSPINKNILRKVSLSLLLPHKKGRVSFKKLMFRAALEQDFLELVLFGG